MTSLKDIPEKYHRQIAQQILPRGPYVEIKQNISSRYVREVEPKPNKYRNQPCTEWNIKFASKRERDRYGELILLERAKAISDLEPHPRYPLMVNKVLVGHYTADAAYRDAQLQLVVEDVKSLPTMTTSSKLRIKLFEAIYGTKVRIIT